MLPIPWEHWLYSDAGEGAARNLELRLRLRWTRHAEELLRGQQLAVTAEGSSDDARKLAVHLSAIRKRSAALEEELEQQDSKADFMGKGGVLLAKMRRWSANHSRLLVALMSQYVY